MVPPSSTKPSRDVRIDVLRGAALVMIFVDHVRGNFYVRFTYQQFSLSTAAWLFVLLSGVSFALKYNRLITTRGLRASMLVALERVKVIYWAHIVSFTLSIGLWSALSRAIGHGRSDLLLYDRFSFLVRDPFAAVPAFLGLTYQPQFFDILPLYMILVAVGPLMLLGLQRAPNLTLFASLACYLLAQLAPFATNLPAWGQDSGWSFHPLAWQFLFLLGLMIGSGAFPSWRSALHKRLVVGACALFLCAAMVSRVLAHIDAIFEALGGHDQILLVRSGRLRDWGTLCAPITLLHVLAVMTVLNVLIPRGSALVRARWLRPLVEMGAHSLEVFVAGVVLSGLCSELITTCELGRGAQLIMNLTCLLMMWGVARSLELMRRAVQPLPAGVPIVRPVSTDR